jgi:hypothetical protein
MGRNGKSLIEPFNSRWGKCHKDINCSVLTVPYTKTKIILFKQHKTLVFTPYAKIDITLLLLNSNKALMIIKHLTMKGELNLQFINKSSLVMRMVGLLRTLFD